MVGVLHSRVVQLDCYHTRKSEQPSIQSCNDFGNMPHYKYIIWINHQ